MFEPCVSQLPNIQQEQKNSQHIDSSGLARKLLTEVFLCCGYFDMEYSVSETEC